jgi:hypothetical protein
MSLLKLNVVTLWLNLKESQLDKKQYVVQKWTDRVVNNTCFEQFGLTSLMTAYTYGRN